MTFALTHDRGFSLVEALVAVVVFCVGVAGVLPALVASVHATRQARDWSMATWLAWQQLEALRGPADLTESPGDTLSADTPGFVDYLDQSGRAGNPPAPYTRRWLIEAGADGNTLRLVVRVHHAAAPGTPALVSTVRRR